MRGFVMLVLVWGACLDVTVLAKNPAFKSFAAQFRHVEWEGFGVWESIQPAFWFVVGAALPFALARRRERGATFGANLRHACIRALKLILLGQFLVSVGAGRFRLDALETLTHLGVIYLLCFLILHLRLRWQVMTAVLIMVVTSALYLLFPGVGGPFSATDNFGRTVDRAVFGAGRVYRTVNFNIFPTTIHMLFGAWTGLLLMSGKSHSEKLKILCGATLASFLAAIALTPFNPVIQRLCTASFTFYGGGFALAAAAAFFWLLEIKAYRRLAFPLVVVGMNSIFIYMLSPLQRRWIDQTAAVFTGRFQFWGPVGAIPQACVMTLVMWYVCYWLYQRKIFFKA
jgi:predicted acyltransferase